MNLILLNISLHGITPLIEEDIIIYADLLKDCVHLFDLQASSNSQILSFNLKRSVES